MKKNYNLGTYTPPTDLDFIKSSHQARIEALRLNNLQAINQKKIEQKVAVPWPKFFDPNTNLINKNNNLDVTIFKELKLGGWQTFPILPEELPYSSPPFTPEIQKLIQPQELILPASGNFADPPIWGPAPSKPAPPPQPQKEEICKAVVILYSGNTVLGWTPGYRGGVSGSSVIGEANVKYDKNGLLSGTVQSLVVDYYQDSIFGGYKNSFGGIPFPVENATYFPWNASSYPLDTKTSPFVRRNLVGFTVWEYWGLKTDIYASLEKESTISPRGIVAFNASLTNGYFYGASSGYTIYSIVTQWQPSPSSSPYLGNGSSPPLGKNKMCCDCNTIATIVEFKNLEFLAKLQKLFENVKDHVDQRTKEEVNIHAKQLESLELDLQPILNRLNEAESNLWNGPPL
jgi:hypothetical protein